MPERRTASILKSARTPKGFPTNNVASRFKLQFYLARELCGCENFKIEFIVFVVILCAFNNESSLLSVSQLNNKGESAKPEFEAFKGSGKTLRQKRKN